MITVFVVTATIQHMYETEKYFEVVGVASTSEGADLLEKDAYKRQEVLTTDCEIHEVQE